MSIVEDHRHQHTESVDYLVLGYGFALSDEGGISHVGKSFESVH